MRRNRYCLCGGLDVQSLHSRLVCNNRNGWPSLLIMLRCRSWSFHPAESIRSRGSLALALPAIASHSGLCCGGGPWASSYRSRAPVRQIFNRRIAGRSLGSPVLQYSLRSYFQRLNLESVFFFNPKNNFVIHLIPCNKFLYALNSQSRFFLGKSCCY